MGPHTDPDTLDDAALALAVRRGIVPAAVVEAAARERALAPPGRAAPRTSQLLLRAGAITALALAQLLAEARAAVERDGADATEDTREQPAPARIGPYRIDRTVASGGMGVVFAATDTRLGRTVCLKLMKGSGERLRRRFEIEAKSAARLAHPAIVRLLGFEEHDGVCALVMDLAEGAPLDLHAEGRPSLDWVLALFDELLGAVGYMHAQGVIHRDLKPGNVIVTPAGRPLLIDFSLAKLSEDERSLALTTRGAPIGTPVYMPPEQITNTGEVDHRADVYSLGVMLYELLAGAPPFAGESASVLYGRILTATPRPLAELRPDLPRWLGPVVAKAMARTPAARYASAEEFRQALLGAGAVASVAGPRWSLRTGAVLAVAGALVLAVGLARPRRLAGLATVEGRATPAFAAPGEALAEALAAHRAARYAARRDPRDLIEAARLDARHARALALALDGWLDRGDHASVLAALAVLGPTMDPDLAERRLRGLLDLAARVPDVELGRAAAAVFLAHHPQAARACESRLYRELADAKDEGRASDHSFFALALLTGLPPHADALGHAVVILARSRYIAGDYARALEALEGVHRFVPQDANAWFHYTLGLAHQALGADDAAIADFGRCVELSNNQAAGIHLAITHVLAGRLEAARERFLAIAQAVRGDPNSYWARSCEIHLAAIEALLSSSPDGARVLAERLEESGPDHLNGLQSSYARAPDYWGALVERHGQVAILHAALGMAWWRLGQRERARPCFERALALAGPDWKHRSDLEGRLGQ